MNVKNFDEVVAQLQSHLVDYLQEHGIDTAHNFKCLNPAHEDSTPSCGIVPGNNDLFHCFSCSASGNIFKAAHYLEGKPLSGKEFVIDTLQYFAQKYNVELIVTPLTEDEIYELDTYRIYGLAHDYIVNHHDTEPFQQVLKDRQWVSDVCKEYGVGSVDAYKNFREYLKDLGFSAKFINDVDLDRTDLFDSYNLVFTVKDELGKPVGFASRNLLYTEDKTHGPKYINQRTTGAKCNIYRKGSRLFGFDKVLKKHNGKKELVYIFEGYADTITAVHAGLTNCVCLGGTSFSIDQLLLLKQYGFYNICLVLDGDVPGQQRTEEILDTTLGNQRDVNVLIVTMPDGYDPDDFIREKGVKEFKKLKKWTAFEWRINRFDSNTEPEIICEKMVPLIANETSAIKRDKLEKILSDNTDTNLNSIHKDVERLLNAREMEKQRERQNILDKLKLSLERKPDEAEVAIAEAEGNLFDLAKQLSEDSFSEIQYIADLKIQKEEEENKDGTFSGFFLGADLKAFEQSLCGNWKQDVWCCLGGKENIGKSSFLLKLTLSVAMNNPDVTTIYFSIDDTKEQLTPRCVCLAAGERKYSINQIADPNYFIKAGKAGKELLEYREMGYSKLIDLAKESRFLMKDANDGFSISYMDRLIRYYKNKYPERYIFFALDNFHKLQDFATIKGDERVRYKTMSTVMKNTATKHHVCIFSTVEYTKLAQGQRPANNNISETGQISYDANLLCHMYSDLHEFPDKPKFFHTCLDEVGLPVIMPRIEISFGKNKISAYKQKQYYNFYPEYADFTNIEANIAQRESQESQQNDNLNRFREIERNGLTE